MEKKKPTNPKSTPNDNDDNRLLFKTRGRATSVSHYIKDSMTTTTMAVQPIAADVAQRDCASRKDKKVHRSKSPGAEEQEESERKKMLKKK